METNYLMRELNYLRGTREKEMEVSPPNFSVTEKTKMIGIVVAAIGEELKRWENGDLTTDSIGMDKWVRHYWINGYGSFRPGHWSSAFINFIMKKAYPRFEKSSAHNRYIIWAKINRLTNSSHPFYAYRINEVKIEIGDIICNGRNTKGQWPTYDNIGEKPESHGDIVIDIKGDEAVVAGGNKGKGTVKTANVKLDSNGKVQQVKVNGRGNGKVSKKDKYFAVIKMMPITQHLGQQGTANSSTSRSPIVTPPKINSTYYPNLDIQDAIRQNSYYNKSLGWGSQTLLINPLLGYPNSSPREDLFVIAVANWQKNNGFIGKDIDGVIGPNTWKKMKVQLGRGNPTTHSTLPNINIQEAIRQNSFYNKSLGWGDQTLLINPLLGYPNSSPREDLFVIAVANWQKNNGFIGKDIDGVIGPNTWKKMKYQLVSMSSKNHSRLLEISHLAKDDAVIATITAELALKFKNPNDPGLFFRRQRLKKLFGSVSKETAKALIGRLGEKPTNDALSVQFHYRLATPTRTELLAILKNAIELPIKPSPIIKTPSPISIPATSNKPLHPSLNSQFDKALYDLWVKVYTSSSISYSNRDTLLCWLSKLRNPNVDDRVIQWIKICPNTTGAIGAARIVGPCQIGGYPRPSQLEIENTFRNADDIDLEGQRLGIFNYIKTAILVSNHWSIDPVYSIVKMKEETFASVHKLHLWANNPMGGSSLMHPSYRAIKDWLQRRQGDKKSLYPCSIK